MALDYLQQRFLIIPLQYKSKNLAIASWREFPGTEATKEEVKIWFGNEWKKETLAL